MIGTHLTFSMIIIDLNKLFCTVTDTMLYDDRLIELLLHGCFIDSFHISDRKILIHHFVIVRYCLMVVSLENEINGLFYHELADPA